MQGGANTAEAVWTEAVKHFWEYLTLSISDTGPVADPLVSSSPKVKGPTLTACRAFQGVKMRLRTEALREAIEAKSTPSNQKASTAVVPLEFEQKRVRRTVDPKTGEVLFSVVDIVSILTEQPDFHAARKYWNSTKRRLKAEGSQLVTNCHQLKLTAQDGKRYKTDVANMETVLRLVQSIPSSKAERFKVWLAKVGKERLEEEIDPSRAIDRAIKTYRRQGRSEEWIEARVRGKVKRNAFTDSCHAHGIKESRDYARLTDRSYQGWSGWTTAEFKKAKELPPQANLREHMSAPQLVVTEIAENSATIIMAEKDAQGLAEVADAVAAGSFIARQTRAAMEEVLGRSIVEGKPALPPSRK